MAGPADDDARATEADVLRIGAEIQRAVERQRAHGLVTPEDVEKIAAARVEARLRELTIDRRLPALFMEGTDDWNIDVGYEVTSHRKGLGIQMVMAIKRLVNPIVRLYTDHVFKRQAQINLSLYHLARQSAVEQARLEAEIDVLRTRLNRLEDGSPTKP
jgi:hypothetical protein